MTRSYFHGYKYHKTPWRPDFDITENYTISIIIPIYNPRLYWLKKAIKTVTSQIYSGWELILVPDGPQPAQIQKFLSSIAHKKIRILPENKRNGISTTCNRGIQETSGQYITFLDQDDLLTPDALLQVARAINNQTPDIIYSDEDTFRDTILGRKYILAHFKPDFSPDLLLSHNYITHLMIIKREIFESIGYFRSELDGAQDYDLILRASEKANTICHIRKVLYHWRYHTSSASHARDSRPKCHDAGKRTLEETISRRSILGVVEETDLYNHFRVRRKIQDTPKVSIIIPFKDQPELLDICLTSINQVTTWSDYEIIGISNNSTDPETDRILKKWTDISPNFSYYSDNRPFNYPNLNNTAAEKASGEYLLFLNNDIEIISPDWIESLLEHAQRPEIGAVGGLLFYPDGTVQHAGIALGIGPFAGRPHRRAPGKSTGYFHRIILVRNVSAITGALLMVEKRKFFEIGGFDGVNFPVSLNDIDLCLRLMEKGYSNLYTPYCKAIHAESVSRGFEDSPDKKIRFESEITNFRKRHAEILKNGDPYYNPNFTRQREDMSITQDTGNFPVFGWYPLILRNE